MWTRLSAKGARVEETTAGVCDRSESQDRTHRYCYRCIELKLRSSPLLTLSPPIPLRLYTLPYWSNLPFLISDIWALWRSGLSARASECRKLKMVGQTSMALNPSNNSNLEQLALKGLMSANAADNAFGRVCLSVCLSVLFELYNS